MSIPWWHNDAIIGYGKKGNTPLTISMWNDFKEKISGIKTSPSKEKENESEVS